MPSSPAPSTRTAGPARASRPSRLRRATELVLVVGTVLAGAAAFGPAWAARVGVGVAVGAAVVACVLAWRELFHAERSHASSMLQASQRHGAQLREHRTRSAAVVETLTERLRTSAAEVAGQQGTIAALRHEVFSLDGDRTSLQGQLSQRDKVVTWLRSTVRSQDAEIGVLRARLDELAHAGPDGRADAAEVHHLPRRVLAASTTVDGGSDVRDLPTFAAVLPNYEDDRRLA